MKWWIKTCKFFCFLLMIVFSDNSSVDKTLVIASLLSLGNLSFSMNLLHWKYPPVFSVCNPQSCIHIQQKSAEQFEQL